jgi:hypothetical protein
MAFVGGPVDLVDRGICWLVRSSWTVMQRVVYPSPFSPALAPARSPIAAGVSTCRSCSSRDLLDGHRVADQVLTVQRRIVLVAREELLELAHFRLVDGADLVTCSAGQVQVVLHHVGLAGLPPSRPSLERRAWRGGGRGLLRERAASRAASITASIAAAMPVLGHGGLLGNIQDSRSTGRCRTGSPAAAGPG